MVSQKIIMIITFLYHASLLEPTVFTLILAHFREIFFHHQEILITYKVYINFSNRVEE